MARDPLDDLLPLVDDPFGIVGGRARRRVLAGSSDLRAFAAIAHVEANQDGRGGVQLGDFGVALSLDPRGRRVLSHLGLDFRGVEARFRSVLSGRADVSAAYRGTHDDGPVDEQPLARVLRWVGEHPPATARTLLMAMTLERSSAEVWREMGVTLATVMNCPADVLEPGALTIEHDDSTPRETLEQLLVDALDLEPREARAAAIAIRVRGSERFTVSARQEERLQELADALGLDGSRFVAAAAPEPE